MSPLARSVPAVMPSKWMTMWSGTTWPSAAGAAGLLKAAGSLFGGALGHAGYAGDQVKDVFRGQAWDEAFAAAGASSSTHQQAASRDALLAKLTSRESQVLERIVAGRLNKQIADDLGISIKTVEAHRANIMEKLNANTVADLLKIALGAQTAKA